MEKSSQKTTIEITIKLRDFLIKKSVRKNQSYEDVIWSLIGAKEITQEDANSMPPEYVKNINEKRKVRKRYDWNIKKEVEQ